MRVLSIMRLSCISAELLFGRSIRFLRSVKDVFLAKRRLVVADLYDAPLTSFGRNAVDRLFTPPQVQVCTTH